ncbi:MAG: Dihydrolipoyllysine-residue acetyltransferase component of pyruvate dehydrogenase complex [Saprospiraceae bacterium]|nr:Dihydrolipoyllysine-residue acetyltransferase component of pyruvate dehydrogenase complex [Saprospiraceae bacterium]
MCERAFPNHLITKSTYNQIHIPMIEFRMPSLGADMEDGTLREWKVKPGDMVHRGDIIADVETMKGIIEIEVFDEGIVEQLLIKEDEKVPVGTVMALIAPSKAEVGVKTPAPEAKAPELHPIEEKMPAAAVSVPAHEGIRASPLAKRIAAENHLDLATVHGTGEGGAITREDVEKAIAERDIKLPPRAPVAAPPAVATDSIRMAVAAAMSKSNREIPHYYLDIAIDMSKALAWLAEANRQRPVQKRLLPVVLLIKAVARSLQEFPDLNALWDNGLQRKKDINIGFVVSLRTGGLVVPAIHHADKKTLDEIMEALNDLIPRARALKLRSSELSESTITLTNLGDGGADSVFGVIYPPQVAIVGFGGITEQPFAENGMLGVRPVLRATLAGDHRATDGLTGSRFLATLKKHLQQPETL